MKGPRVHRAGVLRLLNILLVLMMALATCASVAAASTPKLAPAGDSDTGSGDEALVEFRLPNIWAVDELVALGADLAKYLRQNDDGRVTVNAFITPDERALYESMGFQAGATIEDRSTWEAAKAEREAVTAAEQRARNAAENGAAAAPVKGPLGFDPGGEITSMRVDYFENYAARFLSVAAHSKAGLPLGGATMAMAWKEAGGVYATAATMSKYTDAGQYMYVFAGLLPANR
jgi:hypothetical protein